MKIIKGLSLKNAGKLFWKVPESLNDVAIHKGDFALVDTVHGEEIVQIIGVFNSETDELFFSKSGRTITVKKFVIAIQPAPKKIERMSD